MNNLKLAPNGLPARFCLAFLATAGFFYVNLMPALVDGLIEGLGFTNQQAANVGSANVYGAAFGALLIVFLVKRIQWKPTALALLVGLLSLDTLSIWVTDPLLLVGLRFVHGFVGGMLVGVAFVVMARTEESDRSFGMLLAVQFGLGGLGVMLLPRLVPYFGTPVVFLALIAFSAVTLAMLPLLADYPPRKEDPNTLVVKTGFLSRPLLLTLLAVFTFQAANMGLYALIIGLGRHYGLELEFITLTLGIAAWIGIVGALLVVVLATRLGHARPLLVGMALTLLGIALLWWSAVPWIFWLSNVLVGVTWAFVMPYLLGMCARFDLTGQMAALGGFASKMGLASGPIAAAWLLGENNYPLVIGVSLVVLAVSMIASLLPAARLDRQRRAASGPATPEP